MKKLLLLPVLAVLCLQACKKDEPNDEPKVVDKPADYFFPMKVGNYWVYETLNTFDNSITIDTMRVLRDTIIQGRTYHEFNKFTLGVLIESIWPTIVADSAGYLLDVSGKTIVINDGARDTLNLYDDDYINTVARTGVRDTTVSVPSGSFNCLETITNVYYVPASTSPTGSNPRYMYEYWSKNLGLVNRSYFMAFGAHQYIMTLKAYHLEP